MVKIDSSTRRRSVINALINQMNSPTMQQDDGDRYDDDDEDDSNDGPRITEQDNFGVTYDEWQERDAVAPPAVSYLQLFVVYEDQISRKIWNVLLAMLLLYTGTVFPYRLCFLTFYVGGQIEPSDNWVVVDYVVDILFWWDLFFNFFFTYEDQFGREIDNFKRILQEYLSSHFFINLIACMPESVITGFVSLMVGSSGSDSNGSYKLARIARLQRISRLARLVRLTRLVKLAKVMNHFGWWKEMQKARGLRIINFIFVLFTFVHLLACGWYLVAALHAEPEETWLGRRIIGLAEIPLSQKGPSEQWCHAMYFVLTVFTTVGFGDMSALTVGEIIYCSFCMLVGAVVNSIIVSEVINIVMLSDQAAQHINHQSELISGFAEHCDLDEESKDDLICWVQTLRNHKREYDREGMRALLLGSKLPQTLIKSLPRTVFHGKLIKNRYLSVCLPDQMCIMPPRFPLLLAVSLTLRYFMEQEIVYQLHDQPFNVFLVLDGVFASIAKATPKGGVNESPNLSSATPRSFAKFPLATFASSGKSLARSWTKAEIKDDCNPERKEFGKDLPGSIPRGDSNEELLEGQQSLPSTETERQITQPGTEKLPRMLSERADDLSPYMLYGPRNYFGDFELLVPGPRRSSVRCEGSPLQHKDSDDKPIPQNNSVSGNAGTLLVLAKSELSRLLDEFPTFEPGWRSAAWRREWHRQQMFVNLTRPRKYGHFAARTIQARIRERNKKKARIRDLERSNGSLHSSSLAGNAGSHSLCRQPNEVQSPKQSLKQSPEHTPNEDSPGEPVGFSSSLLKKAPPKPWFNRSSTHSMGPERHMMGDHHAERVSITPQRSAKENSDVERTALASQQLALSRMQNEMATMRTDMKQGLDEMRVMFVAMAEMSGLSRGSMPPSRDGDMTDAYSPLVVASSSPRSETTSRVVPMSPVQLDRHRQSSGESISLVPVPEDPPSTSARVSQLDHQGRLD